MTFTVKNEHRWMNGLISFSIRAAAFLKCQYFQFNSNEDLLLLAMTSAVTGSYHTTCLFKAPLPFLIQNSHKDLDTGKAQCAVSHMYK